MDDNVADAIIANLRERKLLAEQKHNSAQRQLARAQSEADGLAMAYYATCDALAAAESIARQAGEVEND